MIMEVSSQVDSVTEGQSADSLSEDKGQQEDKGKNESESNEGKVEGGAKAGEADANESPNAVNGTPAANGANAPPPPPPQEKQRRGWLW